MSMIKTIINTFDSICDASIGTHHMLTEMFGYLLGRGFPQGRTNMMHPAHIGHGGTWGISNAPQNPNSPVDQFVANILKDFTSDEVWTVIDESRYGLVVLLAAHHANMCFIPQIRDSESVKARLDIHLYACATRSALDEIAVEAGCRHVTRSMMADIITHRYHEEMNNRSPEEAVPTHVEFTVPGINYCVKRGMDFCDILPSFAGRIQTIIGDTVKIAVNPNRGFTLQPTPKAEL